MNKSTDKIASIVAWFHKYAVNPKKACVRIATALLTIAILLSSSIYISSCSSTQNNLGLRESTNNTNAVTEGGGVIETMPAEITTKSPEEIAKSGITAEDVLAELDLIAQSLTRDYFKSNYEWNEIDEATYMSMIKNTRFESIMPEKRANIDVHSGYATYDPLPFFLFSDIVTLCINDELVNYEYPSISISFNYIVPYKNKTYSLFRDFEMPSKMTEDLLEIYGSRVFLYRYEDYQNLPYSIRTNLPRFEEDALTPITIDRNTITNATSEQLTLLYSFFQKTLTYIEDYDMTCFQN